MVDIKKMCKKRLIFAAIQLCIRNIISQVTSVCEKPSARAGGDLKLLSALSLFSQGGQAAVQSVARTRQPVRVCPE